MNPKKNAKKLSVKPKGGNGAGKSSTRGLSDKEKAEMKEHVQ